MIIILLLLPREIHIPELAIHLSFLAFRHVCALFREFANQSLYTSHNITDFVHLWFCEKLDGNLPYHPLWCFVKIPIAWREWRNARWEKWLARQFTKCHLYTSRFSHFANIFSHSRQFDDMCMAGSGSTYTKELIIFYMRELKLFSIGNKNISNVIDSNS